MPSSVRGGVPDLMELTPTQSQMLMSDAQRLFTIMRGEEVGPIMRSNIKPLNVSNAGYSHTPLVRHCQTVLCSLLIAHLKPVSSSCSICSSVMEVFYNYISPCNSCDADLPNLQEFCLHR